MILFENSRMIYIKRLTGRGAMVKTTISIFKKETKGPKISIENNMLNKKHRSLSKMAILVVNRQFFNYFGQKPRLPQ